MLNKVPTYVLRALQILEQNNFEAYIVGGAVRDLYLNLTPLDFDIATNALPQETREIFAVAGIESWDNNGSQFGIVNILIEGNTMEIATFRQEVYGADPHRPEQVTFCTSLVTDLARRDFTINALALGLDNVLIDYYHGVQDLKAKIIRTVGNPEQRFTEDAQRIWRACRLANQLNFSVAENVISAAQKLLPKARELSVERVKNELEKIIISEKVAVGIDLLYATGLYQVTARYKSRGKNYHTRVWGDIAKDNTIVDSKIAVAELSKKLVALPQDLSIRWAMVLQPFNHQDFLQFFSRDRRQEILFLAQNYQLPANDLQGLKKWLLAKLQQKTFSRRTQMMYYLNKLSWIYLAESADQRVIKEFLQWAETLPVHSSELNITIAEIDVIKGECFTYREIFSSLLSAVQSGQITNEHGELLSFLRTYCKRKS